MPNGIAIVGLNGAGKSTLAHALAKELGYFEMDVEDYYFPQQRASRRSALEGQPALQSQGPEAVPFSAAKPKPQVEEAILADMEKYPRFVFSGVHLDWDLPILAHIDLVCFLRVPLAERIRRIHEREARRFGSRVLPGGDMYEQQLGFLKTAISRDELTVLDSLAGLPSPVVSIDGTQPVSAVMQELLTHLD